MGCCESVEEDVAVGQRAAGGGPESAMNSNLPAKAHRKIDQSEEPVEIICGGLRLRYAFLSQRGYYPDDPHKANQDAYSINVQFGRQETDAHFAVYDGHGRDGDLCAQFARDQMPHFLEKHINMRKKKEAQRKEAQKKKGQIRNSRRRL